MPATKITILAAVAGVTAVLLTGCGANGAGQDAPSAPPPDPLHGAPHVEHPLDTAKFEQAPCSVLSPQQTNDLKVEGDGKPDPNANGGPSCTWGSFSSPMGMSNVTFMKQSDGLPYLYSQRQTYGTFRPTSIEGYPGVVATNSPHPEKDGRCDMHVGVTDQLFVTVQTSLNKYDKSIDSSDPCGRAKSVATDVMQTLKKG